MLILKVAISDEIKCLCPGAALGVLHYKADVTESSEKLLAAFEHKLAALRDAYTLESIAKNPLIAATRQAYKALGKSPHEYRNAAEAMLRRIVKGSGLYHINNVVEVNNYISVSSGYSIGSYALSGLQGNIELRHAQDGAQYEGIGKGAINIEHLPVLYDDLGAFGNPSSDSRRAMIQKGRHEILSVIYGFDGREELNHGYSNFQAHWRRIAVCAKLRHGLCSDQGEYVRKTEN